MFSSDSRGLGERIGCARRQKTGNVEQGGEVAGCQRALRSDFGFEGCGPPVAVQHQLRTWKSIDEPRGSIEYTVQRDHAAKLGTFRAAKP